jgi:hypothetical protein
VSTLIGQEAAAGVAGAARRPPGADMQEQTDFTGLNDPEFFRERRRVRERLECLPAHHADRAPLVELYDAMTDEFTRRAVSAWRAS